jgi:hypothetical protein
MKKIIFVALLFCAGAVNAQTVSLICQPANTQVQMNLIVDFDNSTVRIANGKPIKATYDNISVFWYREYDGAVVYLDRTNGNLWTPDLWTKDNKTPGKCITTKSSF